MEFEISIWAAIGFVFAAYAVVGNDALQTLGTFINSNRHLHWTILFAFAALILVLTFTYGFVMNDGDPSFGRLMAENSQGEEKYPSIAVQWYHVLPPAVLLVITRLGIPVSTSFMVLTIFATLGGLGSMIEKSLIGYGVAFMVGFGVYMLVANTLEQWFKKNPPESLVPYGLIGIVGSGFLASQYFIFETIGSIQEMYIGIGCVLLLESIGLTLSITTNRGLYWVVAQWATTAYLWSIWLIQDFANIFVFLTKPVMNDTTGEIVGYTRILSETEGFVAMVAIILLLGYTFANGGGPVQRILRTKSNITDIRSATIVDFIYATLLFFFKELSDIPMSTTWVFLGLIAGREYAFALLTRATRFIVAVIDTGEDIAKAFIGIVLSINLALGLPAIGAAVSGTPMVLDEIFPTQSFMYLVIFGNIILLPIVWFGFSKPEDHPNRSKFIIGGIIMGITLSIATISGFTYLKREVFTAAQSAEVSDDRSVAEDS